jgi:putative phosphoribosyl transferase
MLFKDRKDAGKKLAKMLSYLANRDDVLVLALPRGGVILGYEVCKELNVPLDVILVRKLGVPWQPELALGAIATHDIRVINKSIVSSLNIDEDTIEEIASSEKKELERRNQLYRQGRPFPQVNQKIIVLVDDGIATGATMRAAIKVVSTLQPKKIIVAVPLASSSVYTEMAGEDIDLVVAETPEPFFGIGMWYGDFPQISDEEVINLLSKKDSINVNNVPRSDGAR